jgi:hypothetical protein
MQNAGQDLDRRRLSRAVWPNEGDGLAFKDRQIDSIHSHDFRNRSSKTAPTRDREILLQVFDFHSAVHNASSKVKNILGAAFPNRLIFLDSLDSGAGEPLPHS